MSDKKLTGILIPKDNKKAKIHATFYSDKPIGGGGTSDYSELENKPTINGVELDGNLDSDAFGISDKETIIVVDGTTADITINDNTIYNCGELISLNVTLLLDYEVSFMSQINFSSGATATTITDDSNINWCGDDVDSNGVFTPVTSKRYVVIFYSDGIDMRGVVTATTPLA